DRNRSHWSTSKTPSYTKSVSWQHHRLCLLPRSGMAYHDCGESRIECSENEKQHQIGIFINSIDISALYFLTG
ncbi:hypothetical protein OSL06_14630, partial [Escherichia coli]|nr:hypothetical protein [Escherichia coli]